MRTVTRNQSRTYQVTQVRTDGVHQLESAGTGPKVLKVALIMRELSIRVNPMDQLMCAPPFPPVSSGAEGICVKEGGGY